MEFANAMDAAWVQYKRLEKRLIRFFDYVPLIEDHDGVWSNELGEILILAGTSFNGFLTAGLYCNHFDEYPAACAVRTKLKDRDKDVNIVELRKVYENFYALSQQPVFLLKTERSVVEPTGVVPQFRPLTPFLEWALTTEKPEGGSPEWWDSYTALKHQRLVKVERATLRTVIHAVAAFFMILAVHLCSIPTLSRYGIIHELSGIKPLAHVIEWDLVRHRPRDENGLVRMVPVGGQYSYFAETALFGYAYRDRPDMYKAWLERPFDFVGPAREKA